MRTQHLSLAVTALAFCGCAGESATAATAPGATDTATNDASAADVSGTDVSPDATTGSDTAQSDTAQTDTTGGADTITAADAGDEPDTATGGDAGGTGVSFATVYTKVIQDKGCSAGYCHGGGAGEMLLTDQATAYKSLVGPDAKTAGCGKTKRVVPGKPDDSMLWLRVRPIALDGAKPCADKMPQSSDGLPQDLADLVKQWIVDGALP